MTNVIDITSRRIKRCCPAIEIKHNNAITNDPCAICGARCDPTGIDPFLSGTWALVCNECVKAAGLDQELGVRRRHQWVGEPF
jgi:hypothetical protein